MKYLSYLLIILTLSSCSITELLDKKELYKAHIQKTGSLTKEAKDSINIQYLIDIKNYNESEARREVKQWEEYKKRMEEYRRSYYYDPYPYYPYYYSYRIYIPRYSYSYYRYR